VFDTVILIDDDPISILVGETMFRKTSFCSTVKSIDNAEEALKFLDERYRGGEGLPDLIFLDVRMPVMDGWGFLKEYSVMESLPERTPHVIVLSAAFDEEDLQKAGEYDLVMETLVKPLNQELLQRLLANIRE